jgi:glycerophosphoryl diester phosphodiesterase
LRQLDAGNGEKIPMYAEVLQLIAGTRVKLLLDIKVSPVLDRSQVVRLTEQHGAVLDVIVGVRNLADFKEFRQINPNLRTLGFVGTPEEIENFIAAGVDIIRVWPKWIQSDPDLIAKIHQLGKPVWATTSAASQAEIRELIQLGVDGILSDFPNLLGELRQNTPEID